MTVDSVRLQLSDDPDGPSRTTRTLVASAAARLGTLSYVTGSEAIGSYLAGIAALGRAIGDTSDGQRLRRGLLASRSVSNGEALWEALRIGDWLSHLPPSPVVDALRNDLALLLADDLSGALETPSQAGAVPMATMPTAQPVTVLDTLLGLWAWGRELSAAVEAAAAGSGGSDRVVAAAPGATPLLDQGRLLR